MADRKRRVIQEDDEDVEVEEDVEKNEDSADQQAAFGSTIADSVKSRLRQRLVQKQAEAKDKKRKMDEMGKEGAEMKKKTKPEEKPKEAVIPKKLSTIPKKVADSSAKRTGTGPSLLSMMMNRPPPGAAPPVVGEPAKKPPSRSAPSHIRDRSPPGRPSVRSEKHPPNSPLREVVPNGPESHHGNRGHDFEPHLPPQRYPQPQQYQEQHRNPSPTTLPSDQNQTRPRNTKLEEMVWDTLSTVCRDQLEYLPLIVSNDEDSKQNGLKNRQKSYHASIDTSASFLQRKRLLQKVRGLLDRTSSKHNREIDENLDFFDLDEEGCIIVQPMIPMFPEDFAADSKIRSWPLSWFGIVDPQADMDKEKEQHRLLKAEPRKQPEMIVKKEKESKPKKDRSDRESRKEKQHKRKSRSRSIERETVRRPEYGVLRRDGYEEDRRQFIDRRSHDRNDYRVHDEPGPPIAPGPFPSPRGGPRGRDGSETDFVGPPGRRGDRDFLGPPGRGASRGGRGERRGMPPPGHDDRGFHGGNRAGRGGHRRSPSWDRLPAGHSGNGPAYDPGPYGPCQPPFRDGRPWPDRPSGVFPPPGDRGRDFGPPRDHQPSGPFRGEGHRGGRGGPGGGNFRRPDRW